jgi:RNA polymerase sigma-70 factor (ECF subfamily)
MSCRAIEHPQGRRPLDEAMRCVSRAPKTQPIAKKDQAPAGSADRAGVHSPAMATMLYSTLHSLAECSLQFHSFDASYIGSLCAGDRETQEHFVGYFTDLLRLKLRSKLHSPQAIEDVCQETFTRVFSVLRRDGGLRQPERLGAFVNTTCNHVLFEQYRLSGRSESLDQEGAPEPAVKGASALDLAAARQLKQKVREILLDMAPRDRSLLKAVFLDERDRDEVCHEFGVEREYLRVLLHRAKQEFKVEFVKRIGSFTPLEANG